MAEIESTYASVFEAERKVYGPISEAQSLLSMYSQCSDDTSAAILATAILERFIDAFEDYQTELRTHGHPGSAERVRSEA